MKLKDYIQDNQTYVYRLTDLYILLQFKNKEEKLDRTQIIASTNYPTETVQTCLFRLFQEGILDRQQPQPDTGRFIYWPSDKALEFDDYERSVVNYMYKEYPSLMRPNSALLIFILLVEGKFNIDSLIQEKHYKKSAIYNASSKLKDANIIEKKGGVYRFTDDFIDNVYSNQQPSDKSILELFRENCSDIVGFATDSAGYTSALRNLMRIYNLNEEQAKKLMHLRVSDLVGHPSPTIEL